MTDFDESISDLKSLIFMAEEGRRWEAPAWRSGTTTFILRNNFSCVCDWNEVLTASVHECSSPNSSIWATLDGSEVNLVPWLEPTLPRAHRLSISIVKFEFLSALCCFALISFAATEFDFCFWRASTASISSFTSNLGAIRILDSSAATSPATELFFSPLCWKKEN